MIKLIFQPSQIPSKEAMPANGVETNDHGVLARYGVGPAIRLRQPMVVEGSLDYLPMFDLSVDDPVDMLVAELFQGSQNAGQTQLRADLKRVVEQDHWTSLCPYRVGYEDESELAVVFTVRIGSTTSTRAARSWARLTKCLQGKLLLLCCCAAVTPRRVDLGE